MTTSGRVHDLFRNALPVLLVAAAMLPLLAPSLPWLIDLPAHIARYHVQASLSHSPELARWFGYKWRFLPNLGLDLLLVPLAPLVGLPLAVRLLVAAIPAITVAAMLWIARETRRATPATSLVALPLAFAFPLTYGFVNSCLATALALLAFGWWLRVTRRRRIAARTVGMAVIAPVVLTTHLIGLGVLGLLVAGATAGTAIVRRDSLRRTTAALALACLPVAWPLAMLVLGHWGGHGVTRNWFDWQLILVWMLTLLREQWQPFDLASMALIYGCAALPLLAPRRFSYVPSLIGAAIPLWLAVLLLPSQISGSEFASVRLLPAACAMTLLAVTPRHRLPGWATAAALLFVTARLVSATTSQLLVDRIAQVEQHALDEVAPGSRIAAIRGMACNIDWAPPRLLHFASLATLRRDAFVNDQFAATDGQALEIKRSVGAGLAALPATATLDRCREIPMHSLSEVLAGIPWNDADYLWLLDVPPASRPIDARLRPLWRSDRSILYAIAKPRAR